MKLDLHNNLEAKMTKTVSVLKEDFHSIRAGRANPTLLDRVMVEYYGSPTPLNQLAAVAAPEPRMLTITPYDVTAISDIEKGIMIADLGLNPSNDGKMIRLSVPMLTEERRKELSKKAKKTGEESKVALRNERRHANDDIKKLQKSGELTDDDVKAAELEVQKMTDQYIKMIDELTSMKEKEILAV